MHFFSPSPSHLDIKTGIDLVYIPQFTQTIHNPQALNRLFSAKELANSDPAHLAGLFAVKEAFLKATQIKIKHWRQIYVSHHQSGKPIIHYDPALTNLNIISLDCSISHHHQYATAIVVVLHV